MVRVGLAGIGYIAEEYIRLFSQGKIQNASVCALSSRNEARMQQIQERYGLENAALFSDYDAMLASGKIDMVMICTPHFCHPEMAVRALKHNIHTLIEKPVGVFPEELDSLLDCVRSRPRLRAGVLYCRRCGKAFMQLKQMLTESALGEIRRVTWITTEMYRPQAYFDAYPWKGTFRGEGGGLLMTQVSHQLDLLVWLLGLPRTVQAACHTGKERGIQVENEAALLLEYPWGASGQMIASSRECPGTDRLEIAGTRGRAVLENRGAMSLYTLREDERVYSARSREAYGRIPGVERQMVFPCEENTELQADIINHFVSSVTEGTPAVCPVEQAVQTQQLIQAAYLSAWTHRPVLLPADAEAFTHELRRRIEYGTDGGTAALKGKPQSGS